MSILSGFKAIKKYIKSNNGYQLTSQWTHPDTVEFSDGDNLSDKYGSTSISGIGNGTLTGAISTLNSDKQSTVTGAASTIVSDDLTKSRVAVALSDGKIGTSDTTTTEVAYVHGVTSNIQSQLNNKVETSVWDAQYSSFATNFGTWYIIAIGTIKILYIRDAFTAQLAQGWNTVKHTNGTTLYLAEKYHPITTQYLAQTTPGSITLTMLINTDGSMSLYSPSNFGTGNTTRINFVYV